MVVNFEFLGNEPIENVITCMNFKVDKVIFFGYHEVIQNRKASTENFLKKYCGVQKTVFQPLSHNDLQSVIRTIQTEVERELSRKNETYFDITGGESFILVAFGMLSAKYDTPMHMYDIEENTLIELDEGATKSISEHVPERKVKFDLDKFVELKGGVINYAMHKEVKSLDDPQFVADVNKLWNAAKKHWTLWNPFSDFLKKHMIPDGNLHVNCRAGTIATKLRESGTNLDTPNELNAILDDLSAEGIIKDLKHADGKYEFTFKSEAMKELIWEGGSILELHTYQQEKQDSDDCRVGIHLDWDGIIQNTPGNDVLNEIDVLALKGNVPVFISCKSGKMEPQQTLHALYELQTVTERFGGKYAKMILVTTQPLSNANMLRAKEMKIEVR